VRAGSIAARNMKFTRLFVGVGSPRQFAGEADL
jgi:hypothetical protein